MTTLEEQDEAQLDVAMAEGTERNARRETIVRLMSQAEAAARDQAWIETVCSEWKRRSKGVREQLVGRLFLLVEADRIGIPVPHRERRAQRAKEGPPKAAKAPLNFGRRRKIVDILHESGPLRAVEIAIALGEPKMRADVALADMKRANPALVTQPMRGVWELTKTARDKYFP